MTRVDETTLMGDDGVFDILWVLRFWKVGLGHGDFAVVGRGFLSQSYRTAQGKFVFMISNRESVSKCTSSTSIVSVYVGMR